jgi:hypothetical protein
VSLGAPKDKLTVEYAMALSQRQGLLLSQALEAAGGLTLYGVRPSAGGFGPGSAQLDGPET